PISNVRVSLESRRRIMQTSQAERNKILTEKIINEPTTKWTKYKKDSEDEALQQLYWLRPDINGQSVWFFSMLKKSAKGRILYKKSEKRAYVYDLITQNRFPSFLAWITALNNKRFFKSKKSALATVFLKPNCDKPSIGQIIKGQNYILYFKNTESITLFSIKNILTTMLYNDIDLMGVTLTEGKGFLCFVLLSTNIKKELYIRKAFNGSREPFKCSIFVSGLKVRDDILEANSISYKVSIINEILSIVRFFKISHVCIGQYTRGPQNDHEIIANLENKGLENEAYRKVDCTLLVLDNDTCANCKTLHNTLYQIEKRHKNGIQSVKTSHAFKEILVEIVQKARKELIEDLRDRLKTKFEAEEEQASEPLTSIVHNIVDEVLDEKHENISNIILKDEADQHTGWQDKVIKRMVASMEANSMWGYARIGFFSHDSFKIQKGLLWSQHDNKYVSYIDFDDENVEFEAFGEQSTQVHQIVWHSISHPFNFPIAYFGVETINVYTFNMTLFHLAAKLECAAIHTYGSICNSADENRRHIKSFDWFATIWKANDKVEVQLLNKLGKKSSTQAYHNVSHSSLRLPMPGKIIWKINDQCEVRSTIDNGWYLGKVLTEISMDNYLDIEVIIESNRKFEFFIWKSLYCDIHPVYNKNEHWASHRTINPVTGKPWFFLNDSTHVFKKLRNNVSKSHISNDENKNIREIIFNRWKISWWHFRGIYNHTTKHMTAKATKLTKRHIWLTTWSKMRVNLVEHTLSLDVEKAMANIPELNYISQGTQ
ncbi:16412_t:CDS:2, partial [Dentiscutata erythropus]